MRVHRVQIDDLGDGQAIVRFRDRFDGIAGPDLAFFQNTKVETGSMMRNHQGCHLRFVHADTESVAGDPRL